MPILPHVSGADVQRALERLGLQKIRQSGSHVVMKRELKGCVVPMHSDVKIGTLAGLPRQAEVAPDELVAVLSSRDPVRAFKQRTGTANWYHRRSTSDLRRCEHAVKGVSRRSTITRRMWSSMCLRARGCGKRKERRQSLSSPATPCTSAREPFTPTETRALTRSLGFLSSSLSRRANAALFRYFSENAHAAQPIRFDRASEAQPRHQGDF